MNSQINNIYENKPIFNPIFIIGVPRSGTTLLRVLLDSHSTIAAPPETPWILGGYVPFSLREFLINLTEHKDGIVNKLKGVNKDIIMEAGRAFLAHIFGHYLGKAGKKLLVLKTPDDIENLEFLIKLCPNAKYIHIYRDGRDVACSFMDKKGAFFKNVRNYGDVTYDNILQRWYDWEKKVRTIFNYSDKNYIRIAYEELVINPKETIMNICSFIDIKYEDSMLDYSKQTHEYPEWEAGSTDVKNKKQIVKDSVGRWIYKMDKDTINRLETTYGNFLKELGYKLSFEM